MAFSTSRLLRLRSAVTSGRRRSLCMAGFWGIELRAVTSSSAASAMRLRRLAISSSAMLLRSYMCCQSSLEGGRRWMRCTISPALRRRFVGFLSAASIALSRARRRPIYFISFHVTYGLTGALLTYAPRDPSPPHLPVSLS